MTLCIWCLQDKPRLSVYVEGHKRKKKRKKKYIKYPRLSNNGLINRQSAKSRHDEYHFQFEKKRALKMFVSPTRCAYDLIETIRRVFFSSGLFYSSSREREIITGLISQRGYVKAYRRYFRQVMSVFIHPMNSMVLFFNEREDSLLFVYMKTCLIQCHSV